MDASALATPGISANSGLVDEAARFLSFRFRLIASWPGTKKPICYPGTGSVWPIESLDDLKEVMQKKCARPNLMLHLDSSGVVVMDKDSAAAEGNEWLQSLGVSTSGKVWVQSRCPGRLHVYYRRGTGVDGRHVKLGPSSDVDLLAKGFVILPPSLHKSGDVYRWIGRKSPALIPPCELDPLPDALAEYWRTIVCEKQAKRTRAAPIQGPSANLLESVINALGGRQAGRGHGPNLSFRCPWPENHRHGGGHDDFSLNVESGAWQCFAGCGKGNHLSSLAQKLGIPPRYSAARFEPTPSAYSKVKYNVEVA